MHFVEKYSLDTYCMSFAFEFKRYCYISFLVQGNCKTYYNVLFFTQNIKDGRDFLL